MVLHLLCALSTAALHPSSVMHRRDALLAAASAGSIATGNLRPAFADDAVVKLSQKQIEGKLSKVPAIALVNEEDQPYFTNGRVGYFFLDPTEALLSLRVLQKTSPEARIKVVTLPEVYFPFVRGGEGDVGGELRLRPSRRQVVLANRALQAGGSEGQKLFMPTVLDEAKGQVPIFYSERVAFGSEGRQTFPFFLCKEDLDAAYDEVTGATAKKGDNSGIPIGLVRVATLDGLVDQMRSGAVDLSQSVVVGSRQALITVKQLAQEGALTG